MRLPQSEGWTLVLESASDGRQGLSSLRFPKKGPEWGWKRRLQTGPPSESAEIEATEGAWRRGGGKRR